MAGRSLLSKDLFIGLDDVAHLGAGGEAPMLKTSQEALARFAVVKSGGMHGRAQILDVYAEAKTALARFLGTPGGTTDLAFLGSAAEGFNVLGNGIDWHEGDEVVSIRNEYPSSLLPWLARRPNGLSLVTVDPGLGVEQRIAAAVTDRTRVVCVSYVSYLTGFRVDLHRLSQTAHERGAILAVDASHAFGVLPIPIDDCDVLVSCCYKFALATHGVGIFYLNQRRLSDLLQPSVGWFSVEWPDLEERAQSYRLRTGAARFELGNPAFASIFVLNEALAVLEGLDPVLVQDHVWALGDRLRSGLVGLGLEVWTPQARQGRGPNIVFASANAVALVERLSETGVLAWGSEGRVRFSLHAYNTEGDVDRALETLRSAL